MSRAPQPVSMLACIIMINGPKLSILFGFHLSIDLANTGHADYWTNQWIDDWSLDNMQTGHFLMVLDLLTICFF